MSRQSFEAEFRAFQSRVRDKGLQDWSAFVEQQKTAGQVAVAAVYEMARRHGVRIDGVSSVVFVAGQRPSSVTIVNARVVGE